MVPLVHKALLPLRILRLVTPIHLQVENPTHATAHALEKIFQHKLQYFFSCFNLIIKLKKKMYKLPEQKKLNKTACLKIALYVKGVSQYHVTHDVSVYAIRRRNGG